MKGLYCFLIYCIVLLFSGCATLSVEQEREVDFHYKMGVSYLNEGNIQLAYVHFQKAYQINPKNKDVLHSLGLIYFQLEKFDKAREFYLKALSVDPMFSEVHNNLGVLYLRLNQLDEAERSFKIALTNPLYQTPERAYYNLGSVYYRMGKYESSIDSFTDAIRRSPSFYLAYYGLALAYNRIGRYGDASTAITKAIELDPSYRGNRSKFIEDIKKRLAVAKEEERVDLMDYLEILKY